MFSLLKPGDFFSLLNLSFGFFSMIFAVNGEMRFALIFILLSALSDGADGLLARRFGEGRLGEDLDSLADLTSFSLSPSLLVYLSTKSLYTLPFLTIYIICSAVRLSSFHIFKRKRWFVGLPAPAAGIILASLCMVFKNYIIIDVLLVILSILMVSKVSYPKVDRFLGVTSFVLIVSCIVLEEFLGLLMVKIFLVFTLFYLSLGPLYVKLSKIS
ncbi:MAG: CDP-diacylglycerol--serine O-phosphatidyltransferase [Thermoplasmata archaeon]|nr:MAG: CDP-diacylglycerol--serine O-phosphatidyltransferase [Thermoplasmata archaeon]